MLNVVYNVPTMEKQTWKLSESQKDEICQRYQDGENGTALSKDYHVSDVAIYGILRRRGVKARSQREAKRRLALNESAFDTVTEHSAYWAGFLMADGTISPTRNASTMVKISTSPKDKAHVYAFRDFLGSEHKVFPTQVAIADKWYTRFQFAVRSDRLAVALAKFGVGPRKSHTAKVLLLENNRHFWRGVVDGDGSVATRRRNEPDLRLVGSEALMHQFLDFTLSICDHNVHVRPHKSIFSVSFLGRYAREIITLLYRDCTIALPRKLEIARKIMAH